MFGMFSFGIIEILAFLFILPFCLLGTIFWIWMLVDCATKESDQGNNKIVWILIILFTHFIGALIYFFTRRLRRV